MGWDIEFSELTDSYRLVIDKPYSVYELDALNYEDALDEAGVILDRIGYYEEA